MRKDVCYYFPDKIENVYCAYKATIKQVFKKDAECTPYHTLVFGLNFSFKYNINGGACHIHLMPFNNGTAVDIRYTIAQAIGARCEAHANALSTEVKNLLNIQFQQINIAIEEFLKFKEQQSSFQSENFLKNNESEVKGTGIINFCPKCGNKFSSNDLFCINCGHKRG